MNKGSEVQMPRWWFLDFVYIREFELLRAIAKETYR